MVSILQSLSKTVHMSLLLAILLFLGLFVGLMTLVIGRFLSYNFSSLLLFSGSFALSDYIRGKILTGFPWNLWAYSWSWLTEVLQVLNFLGLFAISNNFFPM